jgi:hypothetical protein
MLAAGLLNIFAGGRAWATNERVEFPYVAYVAAPGAEARSGPGRQHYATEPLPIGYAVEVYRHDGAGWCAIRPPDSSFSLAPIRQLRLINERVAEVASERILVRVGSSVGDDRNAVQVALRRGEAVALLESPSPTDPWIRIAPPAGEFRWIDARSLSRVPPTEALPGRVAEATGPAPGHVVGWQGPAEVGLHQSGAGTAGNPFAHLVTAPTREGSRAVSDAGSAVGAVWQPEPQSAASQASPEPTPSHQTGDDIHVIEGSPAEVQLAQYERQLAKAADFPMAPSDGAASLNGPPRVRFPGASTGVPLDPRVAELQLRLSQIVVGPPMSWQFAGLHEETAALLANEPSPETREQLRNLVDRIAAFESIQTRRLQPEPPTAAAAGATLAEGIAASAANGLAAGNASDVLARVRRDLDRDGGITPTPDLTARDSDRRAAEALYDAVGTLKPVVSRRSNAPQFALVDDHGDVVTFVTAAPDVNLQAYIGQRIGVRGSRGFMPEYRQAHVAATRITPLEGHVVK